MRLCNDQAYKAFSETAQQAAVQGYLKLTGEPFDTPVTDELQMMFISKFIAGGAQQATFSYQGEEIKVIHKMLLSTMYSETHQKVWDQSIDVD